MILNLGKSILGTGEESQLGLTTSTESLETVETPIGREQALFNHIPSEAPPFAVSTLEIFRISQPRVTSTEGYGFIPVKVQVDTGNTELGSDLV